MNSQYFELLKAREKCLRDGDALTAEALWNAAMEIAKLGVLPERAERVRINGTTYDIKS